MTISTQKIIAVFALLTTTIITAASFTAFLIFLYAGSLNWINLGLNEVALLLVNTCLSFAFFLQHSGMVRRSFRRRLEQFIPSQYQGAAYTMASSLVLLVFVGFWQGSEVIVHTFGGLSASIMRALFFFSIAGMCWGAWTLRSVDMFGLEPIKKHLGAKQSPATPFTIRGPYRWVRHPLYFFIIVIIWSCPLLTTDRLLFNILWTIWIIIGTILEERDLVNDFGDDYRDYQARVPMLFPWRLRPAR